LIAELQHRDPDRQPVLHARASAWYEEQGAHARAIDHAIAGHDTDRFAELLVRYGQALFYRGRAASLTGWLEWFSVSASEDAYPEVAVLATWFMVMTGRPVEAERWASAAAAGAARGTIQPNFEGVRVLAQAVMCRDGVDQMARDVELGLSMLPSANPWLPNAYVLLALTSLMRGAVDDAVTQLDTALGYATELGTVPATAFTLSELAICALHRFEVDTAARHIASAQDAIERGKLEGYSVSALTWAVAARVALLQGDLKRVERLAADADAIRSKLSWVIPTVAVQARLDLARCAIGLGDVPRARSYLSEVDDIVHICPDLGALIDETEGIEAELAERLKSGPGIAALTPAESRLLPLLTTHLTLGEIAEQLFVSPHTVKTHAIRIYRKLGVTSRGEAVEVARHLGLLG